MKKKTEKSPGGFRYEVDSIRMTKMTEAQRNQFDMYAENRATGRALHAVLRDWNFIVCYETVLKWYHGKYGKGKEALKTQTLVADYRGVDAHGIEEYATVQLFNLVNRMLAAIDTIEEEAFNKNFGSILDKLPGYVHQLRSLASSLKETARIEPEKETAAAVIEDCLSELFIIFKDSPMESAINEATRAIRRKVATKWNV